MEEKPRTFNLAYHIKYSSTPFTPEELPESYGVADCLLIMSIIKGLEGAADQDNYSFAAMDGELGTIMNPADVWSAWVVLARMLIPRLEETDLRKEVCKKAVKLANEVVTREGMKIIH